MSREAPCPLRRAVVLMPMTGLTLAGCASFGPHMEEQHLLLERPGEALALSRSGRFSARALLAQGLERGAQGRFEWMELQSAKQRRQVLLLLGPLGQSAASFERPLAMTVAADSTQPADPPSPQTRPQVRIYDADGLRLGRRAQDLILGALIGTSNAAALSEDQTQEWLHRVMDFIAASITSPSGRVREASFAVSDARLVMRLAIDEEATR